MNYKSFNLGDWIGHISGVIEDETTLDGNEMRDLVEFLTILNQEPILDKILISIGEEVRDKDIDKDMKDSLNVAISIMHKYQKIRCLINQAEYAGENSYTGEGEWILADKTYQKIQEILKDGNVD